MTTTSLLVLLSHHPPVHNGSLAEFLPHPTMESRTADPDTQLEVDLMILDYLLCVTIDLVLCAGKAKDEGQQTHDWELSWNLKTIDSMIPTMHLTVSEKC